MTSLFSEERAALEAVGRSHPSLDRIPIVGELTNPLIDALDEGLFMPLERIAWTPRAVREVEAESRLFGAAYGGDPVAQSNLGDMYYSGQIVQMDRAEAAKWYGAAAHQGFPPAQVNLGFMYAMGQGLPQDYAEAVKWYGAAAYQNFPAAQHNLGAMCLLMGNVLPQNYTEAISWFHKAADQGLAFSQLSLGLLYWQGKGIPQDKVEAYFWLNMAAASGVEDSRNLRDLVATAMTPEQLAEAQRPSVR